MEALELAALPLDVARRTTMRLATRSALVTRLLARRDSRIACLASLQIVVLFGLALRAPVALFFLGPVLFGVAHLAADVRYLVLRRAPPRALTFGSIFFAGALTALQAGVHLHLVSTRRADPIAVGLGVAWIGLALAVALRDKVRTLAVAAPLLLLAAGALVTHAHLAVAALVHLHNVIALVAWLILFRRRLGWTAVPLVLIVCFSAWLLSGRFLPWTFAHGGLVAFGTHADRLGAWLAPGVRPEIGEAVVTAFVFLQGVHYAAWTGWIPQDDLSTEGTPTFRMSMRALAREFGPGVLLLIAVVALAFAGLAVWNVRQSLSWYMTLATSHAWFECTFLAYFVASGERARAGAS
jgi:hypothetical protein